MHHIFLKPRLAAGPVVAIFWDKKPIKLNGAIFTLCNVLKWVVASAPEAELGALFLNCKEGKVIRNILLDMGHPEPATPVHCDNDTAVGITHGTVKRHKSKSMDMRFFLCKRPSKARSFCYLLAPRIRKFGLLSVKTPH